MAGDWGQWVGVAVEAFLLWPIGSRVVKRQRTLIERDVEAERRRLSNAVVHAYRASERRAISPPDGAKRSKGAQQPPTSLPNGTASSSRDDEPSQDRFALLLVDYYAHGLVQAKRSFAASLYGSVLGGLVLIAGVATAILRAEDSGSQIVSVTTTLAGVVTTSVSALFGWQAANALRHMEGQTKLLRQDMKAERDMNEAVHLLWKMAEGRARDRLLMGLVLKMSGARLPDLGLEATARTAEEPTRQEQSPTA